MAEIENRFAVSLESLDSDVAAAAEGSLLIARSTFAEFRDQPDSHYYAAENLTPEETWSALTGEVGRVTAIAAVEASRGGFLNANDLHLIHRAIFEPVFGAATLGQRRNEQQVQFGIVQGEREHPEHRVVGGLSARSLSHRLKSMCKELAAAFDESDRSVWNNEVSTVIESVRPAAKAYCQFLAWHPYFDGNGRTAFPLLTFALIRMGLIAVAVPETDEFHWCLGRGMRRTGRDFDPFSRHIEGIIKRSDDS